MSLLDKYIMRNCGKMVKRVEKNVDNLDAGICLDVNIFQISSEYLIDQFT